MKIDLSLLSYVEKGVSPTVLRGTTVRVSDVLTDIGCGHDLHWVSRDYNLPIETISDLLVGIANLID